MTNTDKIAIAAVIAFVALIVWLLIFAPPKKERVPLCIVPAWDETLYTLEPDGSVSSAVLKHPERKFFTEAECSGLRVPRIGGGVADDKRN